MSRFPEFLMTAGPSRFRPSSYGAGSSFGGDPRMATVAELIHALQAPETRERALFMLSKNKAIRDDLAPLLWNSFGTISTLLQEVTTAYRLLSSPRLTEKVSTRVCNALALLQCVASHPETRMLFIKANIPMYLYPFLNTMETEKSHEYLRLTSLGVIGALVKHTDNADVVHFLLDSQIFPCCLRCMEVGNELSKTVATFIVHKILLHEEGLKYCCTLAERFFAVGRALGNMIEEIGGEPPHRLLKHIICCYLRLSESPRARDGLRSCLPMKFSDHNFIDLISSDRTTVNGLQQLFYNITTRQQSGSPPVVELARRIARG